MPMGPLVEDFAALSAACADIREEKSLTWLDWTRFSSRQQQKMSLGGVVGTWRLEGPLAPFARCCNSANGCTSARKPPSGWAATRWPTARPGDISGKGSKSLRTPSPSLEKQLSIA
jgi:hypothetical protein